MTPGLAIYLLIGSALAAAIPIELSRTRWKGTWFVIRLSVLVPLVTMTAAFRLIYPGNAFGLFHVLAWALFIHYPVALYSVARSIWEGNRRLARLFGAVAMTLFLIGGYAYLVEPHWLAVRRYSIASRKVKAQIRIALLADIQTDAPGRFEEQVLEEVVRQKPDLIIWAGDYVQLPEGPDYEEAVSKLGEMIKASGLKAPLGSFAVQGNIDMPHPGWKKCLQGSSIQASSITTRRDIGTAVVTLLACPMSFEPFFRLSSSNRFQIVVGHAPDFARGDVKADLLLAGHTHGGQVRLPIIGPPLILSSVPRDWARGLTKLDSGSTLIVSAGIGMERGDAPRLRFLCRPEIVIIDILPE